MGVYGGIQLPKISENTLDDRKERKQILNSLMMLDEKLRYMFQNIDIEENLSADSQELFFKYGEDIQNVINDTEGRFSLFEQTINGISMAVQDNEGNISLLQQTASSLSSSIASAEGKISTLEQTADSINASVIALDDDLGALSSDYEQTAERISWIVKSGTSASSMVLTDSFLDIVADNVNITGFVTFDDLETEGETTINGANITTGEIASDYIHLGDLMAVHKTGYSSVVGGYIGYGSGDDGENASTSGIMMTDKNEYNYFIATTSGVRMTYDDMNAVYCIDGGVYLVADDYGAILDDSNGNFCPDVDDDQLLGKSSRLWQGLYAGNATIQTSDRRKKNSIEYDMEKYEEFFGLLKPTQYKLNNGDSNRYHVGFISQDVEEAMGEAGLDSLDFAGFIKSPVHEVELKNGDYDTTTPIVDHRYALRYGEFVALNTHMIQKLMKRVSDLEAKIEAS